MLSQPGSNSVGNATGLNASYVFRLWVLVTSITPLKVYLFDGGVVIFGSVNKKKTAFDLPADDEVGKEHLCLLDNNLLQLLASSPA